MNIEDYNTMYGNKNDNKYYYSELSNQLVFEPREQEDQSVSTVKLFNNIKKQIRNNILNRRKFFLFLQTIYFNAYLFSKSLEISPYISKSNHNKVTLYSYSYDVFIILFITYSLNLISSSTNMNIITNEVVFKKNKNKFYVLIYCFVCVVSVIVFALLGEFSFLRNFSISGYFWKHLSLKEAVVFCLIGLPLLYFTLSELFNSLKERRLRYLTIVYSSTGVLFSLNYFCLIIYGAENIHYSIHHAIFAGVMAVIFSKWDNILNVIMHGIYMSVLIEGISFFGLQELYIFISKNSTMISYSVAFAISFGILFLWIIFGLFFFNRIY